MGISIEHVTGSIKCKSSASAREARHRSGRRRPAIRKHLYNGAVEGARTPFIQHRHIKRMSVAAHERRRFEIFSDPAAGGNRGMKIGVACLGMSQRLVRSPHRRGAASCAHVAHGAKIDNAVCNGIIISSQSKPIYHRRRGPRCIADNNSQRINHGISLSLSIRVECTSSARERRIALIVAGCTCVTSS